MINNKIEYKAKLKKFLESKKILDRSFKTLTKKREPIRVKARRLLPDLTIYPTDWTYLVSNEKRPHTITVDEFREKELKPGDKVYFERGQIYNWSEYGITADNIVFGSYGSGADPIFLGSTDFGSATWTSETGGYYSTPLATAPLWVTINGECARQGESNWIPATANSTSTNIRGAAATLNPFNTNQALANSAKVRIKEFPFRNSLEHLVTAYNTGTGDMTIGAGGVVGGASGMPFKLYGQKQFATLEGDWWYDDANNELWIKTASSPAGTTIRVITENFALNVEASNFTLNGIEIAEYYETAINAPAAPAINISNFSVHDNRTNGIMLYGNATSGTVSNFSIERCGLNAIHLGAVTNLTLEDGTIDEIGEQANISWPIDSYWLKTGGTAVAMAWDANESITQPDSVTIENVQMTNIGYVGTLVIGDSHNITECKCDRFCTKWNDGSAFYTVQRIALGTSTKNVTFTKCFASRGIGNIDGLGGTLPRQIAEGMYVDNESELITFNQCVSFNNEGHGILCNTDTRRTTITNCLVYGNKDDQIAFYQLDSSPTFDNNGNVMTGNVIVSTAVQFCVRVQSFSGDPNYDPFASGGSHTNNYFVRPYSASLINVSYSSSGSAPSGYTLAQWITKYGGETGSVEIVNRYLYLYPGKQELEVVLASNPTDSTVNVNPGVGYQDLDGNSLGSFTLNAWTARVYLITTTTAPDLLLDTFTGANGTAIAGRTPAVGPIPTISAGTHQIQSNRMATTASFGVVRWNFGVANFIYSNSAIITNIADPMTTYIRYADSSNRLTLSFTSGTTVTLFEHIGGVNTQTWAVPYIYSVAPTYIVSVEANGTNIKIWINGSLKFDITTGYTAGTYGGVLGQTTRTTDYVQAETI